MDMKYFTPIRNDLITNNDLSLGAKGLYCLICFDLTSSLKKLLLNPKTKDETIKYAKELMKYDYAEFYNLEDCIEENSYLGLHVSIQPSDEFKNMVDTKLKKQKDFER